MAERIATIKLNSGQGGFFDELTNIHLTVARPIAHLCAGQNFTNIRKGIAVGHLQLVDGTLGPDPRPYRLVRVGGNFEIVSNKAKKETKAVEVKLKEAPKAAEEPEKQGDAPKAEEKVAEKEPAKEEKVAEPAPEKEAAADDKATAEAPKKTTKKNTRKSTKKADAE